MPRLRLCKTRCSVLPIPPYAATVFIIRSTSLAPRRCPAPTVSLVPQRARRTTKGFGKTTCWPRTSTCIWAVSHTWRSTLSTSAGVGARYETLTHSHGESKITGRLRRGTGEGTDGGWRKTPLILPTRQEYVLPNRDSTNLDPE